MNIIKVDDPKLKSQVYESILRSLPNWFGIESAIVNYINDVKILPTWVAFDGDEPIGFISTRKHFAESAEVHVMGILQKHHRKGIGHELMRTCEEYLRGDGALFLTVKTLAESRACEEYEQTRKFYLKAGFKPLEEFKTLWDEHNPCLFMAKSLLNTGS